MPCTDIVTRMDRKVFVYMPRTPPPYPGHCLCGAVHFQLTEPPLTYYACHCTDCQRRTGGAMRLVMWVRRAALKVLKGEPKLQVFELGDGRQRRAQICSQCDTRLWAEPTHKPGIAMLFPGALEQNKSFQPAAHIWVRSALPWVLIPDNAVRFETQPNNSSELVEIWHAAIADHPFKTAI
jgi:hypothetical protein